MGRLRWSRKVGFLLRVEGGVVSGDVPEFNIDDEDRKGREKVMLGSTVAEQRRSVLRYTERGG